MKLSASCVQVDARISGATRCPIDSPRGFENCYFTRPSAPITRFIRSYSASMNLRGSAAGGDRVAQMAVKLMVEARVDAIFHSSSFGYRSNKSAHQAVAQARKNCWRYDWVVDIDLKSFFDTIDHKLLTRAVDKHVEEPWARLYIKRWLESPLQRQTGELVPRTRGTPQGGVISPLLANLFLHYAFDRWVQAEHPEVPFERYADDVVCHCRTEHEAERFLAALGERLSGHCTARGCRRIHDRRPNRHARQRP